MNVWFCAPIVTYSLAEVESVPFENRNCTALLWVIQHVLFYIVFCSAVNTAPAGKRFFESLF